MSRLLVPGFTRAKKIPNGTTRRTSRNPVPPTAGVGNAQGSALDTDQWPTFRLRTHVAWAVCQVGGWSELVSFSADTTVDGRPGRRSGRTPRFFRPGHLWQQREDQSGAGCGKYSVGHVSTSLTALTKIGEGCSSCRPTMLV
jgi:hypothetical protein